MDKVEGHKYLRILAYLTMREPTQSKEKVKITCQKHREFCEVKFECRECRVINGPRIIRIVEGQVKRIKRGDKGHRELMQPR